jgi:hypothetical protein
MAKITRKTQKIFGGNSSNNGQFGSASTGTPVLDNDPDVIQALPAWEGGWNSATISGEKLPALEEDQGINFVTTRQIAYTLQEGIPEYDADTVYYENSIVKESGTVKLYKSLIDDNEDEALSDPTKWALLVDLDTVEPLSNYTATVDPTVNDDESLGYVLGSKWYNTVSGEAYLCVDPSDGAAVWILISLTSDDLGSAAFEDVGTAIGDVVQLGDVGGGAALPAVDGSLLTNLPGAVGSILGVQIFSSGGSYTPTSGATKCLVRVVGAGGGGGGGRSATDGSAGGNSSFSGYSQTVTANGGSGGGGGTGTGTSGTRGTASGGTANIAGGGAAGGGGGLPGSGNTGNGAVGGPGALSIRLITITTGTPTITVGTGGSGGAGSGGGTNGVQGGDGYVEIWDIK